MGPHHRFHNGRDQFPIGATLNCIACDADAAPGAVALPLPRRCAFAQVPSGPAGLSSVSPTDEEVDLTSEFHTSRLACVEARRVIVKVGSNVVTRGSDDRLALGRLGALVEAVEELVRSGRQVIIVTCGANIVGRQKMRYQQILHSSPLELQQLARTQHLQQSCSAAGQSGLMALWDKMFQMLDMLCAQFLVSRHDFENADFCKNLNGTVDGLLQMGVVPVFNESSMSDDGKEVGGFESHFIDNDGLAARLTEELNAGLLLLLSDADGIYTRPKNDKTSRIIHTYSPDIHDSILQECMACTAAVPGAKPKHVPWTKAPAVDDRSINSMRSKIAAAWHAAEAGHTAVVLNGLQPENLLKVVAGMNVGTLFNKQMAMELVIREPVLKMPQFEKIGSEGKIGSEQGDGQYQSPEAMAKASREASRELTALPTAARSEILHRIADAILDRTQDILAANSMDMGHASSQCDDHVLERLALTTDKLQQLSKGVRQLADMEEPIGKVLARTEIAEGLVLDKITAPIGVLLIIFEARPDVLPQIAALSIRAGNGLLLKGGKEASHSNRILHNIIADCIASTCNSSLIGLVSRRDEIDELLELKDDIDLVIPRGSNQLVSYIQEHTSIPVLGHAEGVCNIYVDEAVDMKEACKICVDSKVDYPAACNAVEKILVHAKHRESGGIYQLHSALRAAGVVIYGTPAVQTLLGVEAPPSLAHEFSSNKVTIDLVQDMQEAIEKIHEYGSGHTDAICTNDKHIEAAFLARVDSACVFSNCSTRFADGYRFGLGAEVGISTTRIHARGPVGVEGLLTTKYVLKGNGQVVCKDTGVEYTHKKLPSVTDSVDAPASCISSHPGPLQSTKVPDPMIQHGGISSTLTAAV